MIRRVRLSLGFAALAIVFMTASTAAEAAVSARGSVKQVYATGLKPSARAALLNSSGKRIATKRATGQGGVLFRGVKPGTGYRLRVIRGGETSEPLTVLTARSAPPSTDVYNQTIPSKGYGYLTTRDGTQLAYSVHPPQDVANALPTGLPLPELPAGPTPTLIEYSGYGYANPAGPDSGIAILANLMGFTVVDVNMRGTGCSGGAFDFFEPLQSLDGYDVVEIVARQPWVRHNKVGMLGISYGGISQLFTAKTRPPSLAAIAPLSVIDATQTTLYPGGVLNTGFAVAWAKERMHEAKPTTEKDGQEWAWKRIQEGDQTCVANQALHGHAANLMKKIRANSHYRPKVADPLSPVTFVDKINVPVFMACQWTDEQTGGHCPTLARNFTGTDRKWFSYTNGTHVDSLAPENFNRMYDFLQLYVAREAPIEDSAAIRAAAPVIYEEAFGVSGVTLPPDPIQQEPTYESALAAFEQLPSVRVLFENGSGGSTAGAPLPGFEHSFQSFPAPGTVGRSFYLRGKGALGARKPARAGADQFTWNARARPLTNFTGNTAAGEGGLWTATPPYKWIRNSARNAVSYVTPPLAENTTVLGAGAVHAWIRSSKPRLDLQATISEVRPDGKEAFVQGGWLRAHGRKLDARKSTPLEPVLSLRARDAKPLPRKRFAKVVIPLYYQGHPYRAGSRIRVTISAPNGDQPVWSFSETRPKGKGKAKVTIARSKRRPSRLLLPVVPGLEIPTELPPCPGLRGQPCRDYQPLTNRPASR
jgi:predicted acyl esterase